MIRPRTLSRAGWWLLTGLWGLYALTTSQSGFGLLSGPLTVGADQHLADALVLAAAVICLARPLRRPGDRVAWLLLGLALATWAAGDLYYSLAFSESEIPPLPSLSDGLWLALYPLSGVALILLARSRFSRIHPTLLVDGVIAALTVTATCVGALWTPVFEAPAGGVLPLATLLAYPLGDAMLLGLVAAVFTLSGWRPDRVWSFLGAGLAAAAIADGMVTYLSATTEFFDGTALDALFPAGALLLASAAWQSPQEPAPVDVERWSMLLTPGVCAVISGSLMLFDHFFPLPTGVVLLAAATLVMILVRTGFTFRENLQLLATRREESMTDHLTGLVNRREFDRTLAVEVERAHRHGRELSLVILDIDHFKDINDSHGHAAGDAVIAHVAGVLGRQARLGELVARIGGEEFAWLLPEADLAEATWAAERARRAIAAEPSPAGILVTLSAGACALPHDGDARSLFSLADAALYQAKSDGRNRVVGRRGALGTAASLAS